MFVALSSAAPSFGYGGYGYRGYGGYNGGYGYSGPAAAYYPAATNGLVAYPNGAVVPVRTGIFA